jgi:HSP20 family protein|tara:strand:- start:399 stop:800 length:402 start_codon:yes stop_codon:yes gene_type:complete
MTTLTRHKGNSLFDTVFSDLFNDEFITRPYMSAAKRNSQVLNRDEDWQIVFAIPGVKKHEVAVKVDDFVLSVSYDNKANTDQFNFVSSFSRSWNLGHDVDVNKITANHEDGILTITVPKPETKKRVVRTIEVG